MLENEPGDQIAFAEDVMASPLLVALLESLLLLLLLPLLELFNFRSMLLLLMIRLCSSTSFKEGEDLFVQRSKGL
jgi:hypothetical protein